MLKGGDSVATFAVLAIIAIFAILMMEKKGE